MDHIWLGERGYNWSSKDLVIISNFQGLLKMPSHKDDWKQSRTQCPHSQEMGWVVVGYLMGYGCLLPFKGIQQYRIKKQLLISDILLWHGILNIYINLVIVLYYICFYSGLGYWAYAAHLKCNV